MDLNQIKNKLANLQKSQSSTSREKKDWSKIYWKPAIGKSEIRVVPNKNNPANPFVEVRAYYGIGPNNVMISPLNFGEKDPIKEFADMLRKDYSKENFFLAKKLDPKVRTFVPIIVRGEEEKGVRWWEFGATLYQEMLAMALDEEIGDFTDVANGLDFKLETVGPESTGTKFNKTTIRPKMKTSKLSADKAQVELWLEEQPDLYEKFKRYTFEEMKDSLEKWLEPEEDDEAIVSENSEDFDGEENFGGDLPGEKEFKTKVTTKGNGKAKASKDDEWNNLFKEDNEE